MEIGKALTYIFEDKRWFQKTIIAWLITIVPILNFAFAGYVTKTLKNVEAASTEPLPEWDDLGQKFTWGLLLLIAAIIYALPVLILSGLFVIPTVLASGNSSDALSSVLAGGMILVSCLISLYALALSFFYPAVHINFSRTLTLGSCFQFSEIFKIFKFNSGNYLLAWFMAIVWSIAIGLGAGIIAFVVGLIPCIGWIADLIIIGIASVATTLVYAHLFGQVAQKQRMSAM